MIKKSSDKKPLTRTRRKVQAAQIVALIKSADQYRIKGKIDESLKRYHSALKAGDGRLQEALLGIGLCHEIKGETGKAFKFFDKARRLGVLPLDDFLSIARFHSELCDFEMSMKWLRDALYHYPRTEDIHSALRDTLLRQAQFRTRYGRLRQGMRLPKSDEGFAAFVTAFGDAQAYLDRNPDVAEGGIDAHVHWLEHGMAEGRILPGIEVRKPSAKHDTVRPWRYFAFRGNHLQARVNCIEEKTVYDVITRSWAHQKRKQAAAMDKFQRRLSEPPLISVVVPVYNTDPVLLCATIESVRAQKYTRWELCLADDRSTSPNVARLIREYAAKDKRIRTAFRKRNGGISAATNSAIALAKGDFVAFLDHDDLLDECALLCIVKALRKHPGARLLYTDEDKITADGVRYDPHFKPDWNREFFYAQNYISHLSVIRKSVLLRAGKLRPSYDGSQDYDLLLRCIEIVDDADIIHIPKVLYSWRAVEGSTALSRNEKPHAWEAGRRALTGHLRRVLNSRVPVEPGPFPFSYKPDWTHARLPAASIIIPTRDRLPLLKVTVGSILAFTRNNRFEILIVDNGSVEAETLQWFRKIQSLDSRVRVLRHDVPFNYSNINNFAVGHSAGDVLVFLNNDVEIEQSGWLAELTSLAVRPDIGCVGAKLLYPDRTVQHGGVVVGIGGVAGHTFLHAPENATGYFGRLQLRQEYTAVTGACLAIRRSVFEAAGGFDEVNLPVAFNDTDLCLKVRALGYRNLWTPYATLIHHESASRGREDTPVKRARFMREARYMHKRWKTRSYRDPAYNINLTLQRADFSAGTPVWTF